MKKVLSIVLVLTVIFLLAACGSGKSGKATAIMTPKEFPSFIQSYVDTSHYKEPEIEDDHCGYSLAYEYYPEYMTSKEKQLLSDSDIILDEETTIYNKMPVSDFISQGWNIKEESELDKTLGSMLVTPGTAFERNGKEIDIKFLNDTDHALPYKETKVGGFHLYLYSQDSNYTEGYSYAVSFEIEGKINNTSKLRDIIDVLGDPSSIYYAYYHNTSSYSSIELIYDDAFNDFHLHFKLSGDGNRIAEVYVV